MGLASLRVMLDESPASARRTKRAQGSAKIQAALLALAAALLVVPFGYFGEAAARTVAGRTNSAPLPLRADVGGSSHAGIGTLAREVLSEARRYARVYGNVQRRFNGVRPGETLVRHTKFSKTNTGMSPFWDIAADTAGVERVGAHFEDSPFLTSEGKIRVFAHYLDKERIATLQRRFGEPTGRIRTEMTSSYRSVIMFPDDGTAPYMLKFPGEWKTAQKNLPPPKVRISVARSEHLLNSDHITPEPAGLILGSGRNEARVLYRPIPLPETGLQAADALVPAQALFNTKNSGFERFEPGRRLIARSGSIENWNTEEFAPALAKVIYDSVFEDFTHLELHSQNIDALIGADGAIRGVYVKDLLDMMHDPILEVATTGKKPVDVAKLRDIEWKHIGEPGASYDVYSFHNTYLRQTANQQSTFAAAVQKHLLARARETFPEHVSANEFDRLASENLYDVIRDLREIRIRHAFDRQFGADASVSALFDSGELTVASGGSLSVRRGAGKSAANGVEYGYIGEVPAAIERGDDGRVVGYKIGYDG